WDDSGRVHARGEHERVRESGQGGRSVIDRARVAALYRYPVKGLTPEPRGELTITARGRAKGDRAWSLRFPHGTRPDSRDGRDYWPKGDRLWLRDFPSLARLRVEHAAAVLRR